MTDCRRNAAHAVHPEIFSCDVDSRRRRASCCRNRSFSPSERPAAPHSCSGESTMRVLVIVKATTDSESGRMPDPEMIAAMGRFNEELAQAGILLAADGLHPSMRGKRVHFAGKNRHRRPVRRNEGTRRRLLAVAGEIDGRGGRMGEALPEPDARRLRHRDPPAVRGGRLQPGVHGSIARTKGAAERASRPENTRKSLRRQTVSHLRRTPLLPADACAAHPRLRGTASRSTAPPVTSRNIPALPYARAASIAP